MMGTAPVKLVSSDPPQVSGQSGALVEHIFGDSSDSLIPADYDGDGIADIAIFRGTSGLWALRGVSRVYFGTSGDVPVSGRVCNPVTTTPSP